MHTSIARSPYTEVERDLPNIATALRLRIAVLAESRYLSHRQPAGLAAALAELGHVVDVLVPEDIALTIGSCGSLPVDGVVARGRSDHLLSVLRAVERVGMPTVNRSGAVVDVRDKASMAAALEAAGVPIPPTMLGTPARLSDHVPDDWYPLLLKPLFGDNSQGLYVVADAVELLQHETREVLAQPYLATDGTELKLYAVGDEVWAIRRPASFAPPGVARRTVPPQHVTVTRALRALALRCGELFGLELYGVDCLTRHDGIVVVEVNDFPNYTDIPEASLAAAQYVSRRLRGAG